MVPGRRRYPCSLGVHPQGTGIPLLINLKWYTFEMK